MNVGCLSVNAPTGVGFEMRWIMNQISKSHDTFFLSVPDSRFSSPSEWDENNYVTNQRFIPIISAINWVIKNKIECLICKQEQFNNKLLKVFSIIGVKTIVSVDLEDFDYNDPKWKFCNLFICPTKHSYDYLEEKGFNQKVLSYMGLDSTYFKYIPRAKSEDMLFLHTAGHGGVGFRKSTPETVLAFELASKIIPHISLLILSQIPIEKYPSKIREIIKNSNRIEFRNTRDKNNIEIYKDNFSLYVEGDVAIQPSKWEGMGASIYEALMMGLPVLTTNFPPMNEYVDNSRGFLLDPESHINLSKFNKVLNKEYTMVTVNIRSLAKIIISIANKSDIEVRSKRARKFMEKFDWAHVSKDWNRSLEALEKERNVTRLSFSNLIFLSCNIFYESLFYLPLIKIKSRVKKLLNSQLGTLLRI